MAWIIAGVVTGLIYYTMLIYCVGHGTGYNKGYKDCRRFHEKYRR